MWPGIRGIRARETTLPPADREARIEQLVNSFKEIQELVYKAGFGEGYAKGLGEGKKHGKGDD